MITDANLADFDKVLGTINKLYGWLSTRVHGQNSLQTKGI
jgi:hypothetical protein